MQEEIKRIYQQWKNALIKTDLATLEKMHADNFLWTNNMGISCNKLEYLFKIRSGNVRYISLINENMKIDVAQGHATIKATEILNIIVFKQIVCTVRYITATFQLYEDEWLLSKIEERKNVI